ncbi:MAG: archaellin/type IV pilin N-terminal domain-containing protein [Candidatus Nanohalobium sp.]
MDRFTSSSRKGITPVIATVLLLGITVAIGLTVYTQAQGMIQGTGSTKKLDKAQNTQIDIVSVTRGSNGMQLTLVNKGERAINTSKFSVYYSPPTYEDAAIRSALPSAWKTGTANCFKPATTKIRNVGEQWTCSTGVTFPGALEEVGIKVRANNFGYSTSYTCSVETSNAQSC